MATSEPTEISTPLPGPVTTSEFRARFAEMIERTVAGEEIVVLRGSRPVSWLVPIEPRRSKRLGPLNDFPTDEERRALDEAICTPLPAAEQRVIEGEGTDDLGIRVGLPEDRGADRTR